MPKLTIPPSEIQSLRKLADLAPVVFSNLLKALERLDTKSLQVETAEAMAKSLPEIKSSDLQDFLKTIYSLYSIKAGKKLPTEEIASDIADNLAVEKPAIFTPDKAKALKEKLTALLDINKTLGLTAKSLSVMTEQPHIFLSGRVLCDIRPVFESSPESISAAMIIHSLNIHYSQDGNHKEFFVAMNTSDVRKLKATLERAEKKAETLQAFIEKSSIPYFEDRE